jgi:hypothetical protein
MPLGKLIFAKEDQGALVHAEESADRRNRAGAGFRADRRGVARTGTARQPGGPSVIGELVATAALF